MKKKVKNIIIIFVISTIACIFGITVNAETTNSNIPESYEVRQENIPNATYVIGTHMFTREQNEENGYDGQLSTQLIMLASQTINSEDLNDMVIYYKNPRGKWVDALTGDYIVSPETFEIAKKDLEKYVLTPILQFKTFVYTEINQMQDVFINIENYKDYYVDETETTYNVSGIEFYKTWTGGDGVKRYSLINSKTMNPDSFISLIEYSGNKKETYVARTYILDAFGNKIYSDYSNEVKVDLYESSDGNTMSLEEFKNISNTTTLGELKAKYNIEPSIANMGIDLSRYLYDFKGYINNSSGITPNVQFAFGSDIDSANVKAKVYRNDVCDEEIDHSQYDNGDGEIGTDDFEELRSISAEELENVLGDPYAIKVMYEDERYGIFLQKYTYKIKDSDKIITYSIDENNIVTGFSIASSATSLYFPKQHLNKTFISEDEEYELKITNVSNFAERIEISLIHKDEVKWSFWCEGEARATALGMENKFEYDFRLRSDVEEEEMIIGRGMFSEVYGTEFVIDCYVFKKTENLDGYSPFNDLDIGYNKIKFTLREE